MAVDSGPSLADMGISAPESFQINPALLPETPAIHDELGMSQIPVFPVTGNEATIDFGSDTEAFNSPTGRMGTGLNKEAAVASAAKIGVENDPMTQFLKDQELAAKTNESIPTDELAMSAMPILETPEGVEPEIDLGNSPEEIENGKAKDRAEMLGEDDIRANLTKENAILQSQYDQLAGEVGTMSGDEAAQKSIVDAINRTKDVVESLRAEMTNLMLEQFAQRAQAKKLSGTQVASNIVRALLKRGAEMSLKAIEKFVTETMQRPSLMEIIIEQAQEKMIRLGDNAPTETVSRLKEFGKEK